MFAVMRTGDRFVERTPISAYDFTKADYLQDNAYHDVNLSSIVPCGNIPVLIQIKAEHVNFNKYLKLRKKGSTTDYEAFVTCTVAENKGLRMFCIVPCNADRLIEINLSSPNWKYAALTIQGWWV